MALFMPFKYYCCNTLQVLLTWIDFWWLIFYMQPIYITDTLSLNVKSYYRVFPFNWEFQLGPRYSPHYYWEFRWPCVWFVGTHSKVIKVVRPVAQLLIGSTIHAEVGSGQATGTQTKTIKNCKEHGLCPRWNLCKLRRISNVTRHLSWQYGWQYVLPKMHLLQNLLVFLPLWKRF